MLESDIGICVDTTANIILTEQGIIYGFDLHNGDAILGTEIINLRTRSLNFEVLSSTAVVTHQNCVSIVDLES